MEYRLHVFNIINDILRWTTSTVKAFKHAQSAQIQIILCIGTVSPGHLLSIETFFSRQYFCFLIAKALKRLRGCAGCSRLSMSAYARRNVFAWPSPHINRRSLFPKTKCHQYSIKLNSACLWIICITAKGRFKQCLPSSLCCFPFFHLYRKVFIQSNLVISNPLT